MKSNVVMSKALIVLSTIAFLCAFIRPVKALADPTRIGFSSSLMYENLSFDIYQTGAGDVTYTITASGTPTFEFDELNVNGWLSTTYSDGTRNIIIDSDMNVTGNQYNVSGNIDLSDLEFTVEASGGTVQNTYRYYYTKIQRIAISYDAPVTGVIYVTPTSIIESGYQLRPVQGCTVRITSADVSTGKMTIRATGESLIIFDLYKEYSMTTSMSTNNFFNFTSSTISEGTIETYETPVSDGETHSRLNIIQGWLSSIHSLLDQAQQGVDDLNDDLADKAQDLDDLGGSMHSTETDMFDSMDTALSNPQLNLNISSLVQAQSKPRNGFKWVADQLQYIAIDLGSGITAFWGYLFVFPLILGIAFIIVGRMK